MAIQISTDMFLMTWIYSTSAAPTRDRSTEDFSLLNVLHSDPTSITLGGREEGGGGEERRGEEEKGGGRREKEKGGGRRGKEKGRIEALIDLHASIQVFAKDIRAVITMPVYANK